MQVEKAEERMQDNNVRSLHEFQEEVKQLWDTHIRNDLIYGKKLRFCRTCFSFYYQTTQKQNILSRTLRVYRNSSERQESLPFSDLLNFLWNCLLVDLTCLFQSLASW